MSTIKGPHIALSAAKNTRSFWTWSAMTDLPASRNWSSKLKEGCSASSMIQYIGPQSRAECVDWFCKNKALLHPNETYREPFGLAPVEAQLCGMPVIAWNNGAMRETIKEGETGFLVSSQQQMEDLMSRDATGGMKPETCREWASQFS
jgi:glycosyltransferase involved in cell wall biosynthesis